MTREREKARGITKGGRDEYIGEEKKKKRRPKRERFHRAVIAFGEERDRRGGSRFFTGLRSTVHRSEVIPTRRRRRLQFTNAK